ncbi:SOS response-associated peptidase family protein [Mesorhizobium sp.]|uniref:SOS response-associated peptidase family protein n=1 Tax=Mesorhizobium sp. TaxID=1871066 RepID=UPI00257BD248|nr:SOS response-associated peptidase family protein [Mesorhizobium sp.]
MTGPASDPMKQIHERQPVILDQSAYDAWLNPGTSAEAAKQLVDLNLNGPLQFYRVSRDVNATVKDGKPNDSQRMIEPIALL